MHAFKQDLLQGQGDRRAMRRTASADNANAGAIGTLRVEPERTEEWPDDLTCNADMANLAVVGSC